MFKEKVHLVSLGCPKNLVDSEVMAASLKQAGFEIYPEASGSQIAVVNTCSFIESAKRESIEKILELGELKEKGDIQRIVLAGCLAQRYKEELVQELPEVDVFVGSGHYQEMGDILTDLHQGIAKKTYFELPTFVPVEGTQRLNSQPSHRAYLKISDGCLKRCSFCAIPLIRGNLKSRKLSPLLSEARLLAASGVKELIVVSHDFTDYGWDLRRMDPQSPESPERLLRELCRIDGIEWIRLLYLYPDAVTKNVVEIIRQEPKMVKYFDMPLQHVSDRVLKSMNRKMTRQEIEEIIEGIRLAVPNAVIRTQFIVGFPGETEEDFLQLLDFVEKYQFERVGCFMYSAEENTPGGRRLDQVDEVTKQRRHDQLMSLQKKISRKLHKKYVGRTVDVIVEGLSPDTDLLLQGRMSTQAPEIDGIVYINDGQADVGQVVRVEITDSLDYDLVGRIVRAEPMAVDSYV